MHSETQLRCPVQREDGPHPIGGTPLPLLLLQCSASFYNSSKYDVTCAVQLLRRFERGRLPPISQMDACVVSHRERIKWQLRRHPTGLKKDSYWSAPVLRSSGLYLRGALNY